LGSLRERRARRAPHRRGFRWGPQEDAIWRPRPCRPCHTPAATPSPSHLLPQGLPIRDASRWVPSAPDPLRRHRAGLRASVTTRATDAGFPGFPERVVAAYSSPPAIAILLDQDPIAAAPPLARGRPQVRLVLAPRSCPIRRRSASGSADLADPWWGPWPAGCIRPVSYSGAQQRAAVTVRLALSLVLVVRGVPCRTYGKPLREIPQMEDCPTLVGGGIIDE
jgi:hypothetical protein